MLFRYPKPRHGYIPEEPKFFKGALIGIGISLFFWLPLYFIFC